MAKTDLEDIRYKVNSLISYINETTRTEKIKYALREEYKQGRFHDIPGRYLKEEIGFVEELEEFFVHSNVSGQRLPLGLLSRTPLSTYRILASIVIKIRNGIHVDTQDAFENEISFVFDNSKVVENFFEFSKKYKMPFFPYADQYITKRFHLVDKDGKIPKVGSKEPFKPSALVTRNLKFEADFLEAIMNTRIGIIGKLPPVIKLPSKYPWLEKSDVLEKSLHDKLRQYYKDEFAQIELDNFALVDTELGEFLNSKGAFFREDAILGTDAKDVEALLEQKKFLLSVVQNLDKIGALDELIKNENTNIKALNGLLPDNPINLLTRESVYKSIEDLDMNNSEDAIKMLIMNRQFSNKLAHNYVSFIYAGLYMNSIGDKEYALKRAKTIERIEQNSEKDVTKILELLNISKEKYNALYQKEIEEQTAIRDEKVRRLRDEGKEEEAEILSKEKVKVKIKDFSFADDFFKAYRKFGADARKMRNMITGTDSRNETYIRDDVKKTKEKEYKKIAIKDDKLQYCIDIYKELSVLMKWFEDLNKDTNGIVKRESFHDLVARILRNPKGKNDYSHLETTIGGEKINIGKSLEKLIDRVSNDGIIKNPLKVLSCITKRMEFTQQLFSCKHLFTKSLLNASKKYPDLVALENNPIKPKYDKDGKLKSYEDGVVDIYYKGALQIFGGHYKPYEPEVRDYKIQALQSVDPRVDEGFRVKNPNTGDPYFSTYIPFFHVTEKQIKRIKWSLDSLDDIEDAKEKGFLVTRVNQYKKIQRDEPELFEFARKRAVILTDELRFEKTREKIILTKLQERQIEMALEELRRGTTIEEIEREFSSTVIDYIVKEILPSQFGQLGENLEGESSEQNKKQYEIQSVNDVIKNGRFKMETDYDESNQEKARAINIIPKQNDGKSKED